MNSYGFWNQSDENCSSKFRPKTPHFYKIILDDTIQDQKLEIPREFVRKYGNGLSSPVLLKVPSGDTWEVELKKSDGDVWLQNGWQEFVQHYSQKYGHFLVFKYEGNGNFQVLIFDMSATEIEYPYVSRIDIEDHKSAEECQEPDMEETKADTSNEILCKPDIEETDIEETKADTSNEILCKPDIEEAKSYTSDESLYEPDEEESESYTSDEEESEADTSDELLYEPSSKKSRKKLQSPCSHPHKKLRTTRTDKNKNDCEHLSSETHAFGANKYNNALQRASAFKPENPFFVVTMQPSYINPGRKMCLPKDFITNFLKEDTGDVTLCTSEGKTWSAQYLRYINVRKYTKAILYNGWRNFMRDNKLEAGDVCVFELIKQTEMLLKVVIYRVSEDSNCSSSLATDCGGKRRSTMSKDPCLTRPMASYEKARAIQRAKSFRSENPFFKVVMQQRYLTIRNSLSIPYKFVKRYLDEKKKQAILKVSGGKTRVVKFQVKSYKSGYYKAEFYNTWRAFAEDNNLEVGDVCVFELINRDENSFKVSIFPAAPAHDT